MTQWLRRKSRSEIARPSASRSPFRSRNDPVTPRTGAFAIFFPRYTTAAWPWFQGAAPAMDDVPSGNPTASASEMPGEAPGPSLRT